MAGSVTPQIPEINAGSAKVFSFLSLVLINIANTTAVCEKDATKFATRNLSYFNVA